MTTGIKALIVGGLFIVYCVLLGLISSLLKKKLKPAAFAAAQKVLAFVSAFAMLALFALGAKLFIG